MAKKLSKKEATAIANRVKLSLNYLDDLDHIGPVAAAIRELNEALELLYGKEEDIDSN